MKIRFSLPVLLSSLALALPVGSAHADQTGNAVTGALIGGAAGAVIGHQFRGRNGALVGGVLGAATGAAVATAPRDGNRRVEAAVDSRDEARDAYVYRDDDDGDDRDVDVRVRTRVVYDEPVVRERVIYREAPPVVVYRPAPVVVYRDAPVYYQPVRQVVRYDVVDRDWHGHGWEKQRMKDYYKWRHHHGRGHDRDDD